MTILDPAIRRSCALYAGLAAIAAVLLLSIPVAAGRSAPPDHLQWSGDHLQWTGTVAQGKTIVIQIQKRGVHGAIRAIASEDDRIHVDARRSDATDVGIELAEHDPGVAICVDECQLGRKAVNEPDYRFLWRLLGVRDVRVDFVVRVPAGVRFSGSTLDGDIDVKGVRAEVRAVTINGNVTIQTTGFAARVTTIDGDVVFELPAGADAEFHANAIKGTIESDVSLSLSGGRLGGARFARPFAGPFLPNGDPLPEGRAGGPPQIVNAIIGNGGPELRVTTINGNISLRQR